MPTEIWRLIILETLTILSLVIFYKVAIKQLPIVKQCTSYVWLIFGEGSDPEQSESLVTVKSTQELADEYVKQTQIEDPHGYYWSICFEVDKTNEDFG